MVRVHVLGAKNLVAKDTHMMGMVKGKSDPYTVLRVGNKQFKTKTIKETLSPCWNEVYEVTEGVILRTLNPSVQYKHSLFQIGNKKC